MNRNPIDIPILSIGPGTQNQQQDEMDILNLPTGSMATFTTPVLPEPEEAVELVQGKLMLNEILQALKQYKTGDPAVIIDLAGLSQSDQDLVNQALGEGEVSVVLEGPDSAEAQESILAGVWRVQYFDGNKNTVRDTIEIADIPHIVKTHTFANARNTLPLELPEAEAGLMNAPSLLAEIKDQHRGYHPAKPPHVINLTLLPLTEGELRFLGTRLGTGPLTILSRGYGNCRIGSTQINNVWWIKYYNSDDRLILNTIEVSSVPEIALAAQEDIDDSALRLNEILELYR